MAYLGNVPARSFISFEKQVFTIVNSQTAYTLSHSVTNENDIRLVINNVIQEPGSGKAYTASGTTLTLSAALVNGTDEMYCVFLGRAVGTVNPPAASVDTAQLAADAVTGAKIADDAISDEHLDPTAITGQTAETSIASDDLILLSDTSASGALKKMTRANFVSGVGGNMTPAFSVRQTTNQTGLSSDTLTKISFQSEVFDTDNAFASDKFTVPSGKGGRYFFDASTRIRSATVFQLRNAVMYFYKNGSAMGSQYSAHYNSNLMLESRQNYSFVDDASAGDYYEIYATGTVDSGTVNLYQTTFTGFKILE
jgi:hypothetical protein